MMLENSAGSQISGRELGHWRTDKLNQLSSLDNEITQTHAYDELARELDWLIREVTDLDRLALRLGLYKERSALPSSRSLTDLERIWQARIQDAMPLQYSLGYCNWRHFQLEVAPQVLIPRPETEELIDLVAQAIEKQPRLRQGHWLDLGTGSGAIALGLADLMPSAKVHAVDISEAALAIARRNATRLQLQTQIQFWQGSWFEPLPHQLGTVAGICSNPPYIPTDVVQTLQPEVLHHEPHLALDGGEDGLNDIRHLIQTAQQYLQPAGFLIMECMAGQGAAIATLMATSNYQKIEVRHDLAGHDRFVSGWKADH